MLKYNIILLLVCLSVCLLIESGFTDAVSIFLLALSAKKEEMFLFMFANETKLILMVIHNESPISTLHCVF